MTEKRMSYTQEIADLICERIALGETILKIAGTEGMPCRKTIYNWLAKHEEFREKMAIARQYQADSHADEMYGLLDELKSNPKDANAIRVQADILKWQAMVRAPRKYGELIRQEVKVDAPLSPEQAEARIRQLEQELGLTPSVSLLAADLGGKQ